ncbi:MAG: hypothetical protein JST16_12210 [Bdellovibrionales bacterium]|nr:hypothetical protein [Bdellovibrionales bacterium]
MFRRILACALFIVTACTTLKAFDSPSRSYRNYIDAHLKEDRVFDRGREMLIAKALPVTQSWRHEQTALSPVPSVPEREGIRYVVLALNVAGREPSTLYNWTLLLGGRKSRVAAEITDTAIIENQFYFGHPFHRIYVVEFPMPDAPERAIVENLEVLSPYGKAVIPCDFSEASPAVDLGGQS